MPRQPRYFFTGYCFHLIARGVDRQATFFHTEDYELFRRVVSGAAERYGCRLHAYVLMTNHVHLLATPENSRAIPRLFQAIGRSYVQAINRKYERTGALWEGRYKACLVDTTEYLLTCYRYIELNPVRAGLVRSPCEYPYSSYHHNAAARDDPLVSPHEIYLSLGLDRESRCAAYRELFGKVISERELSAIRESTNKCHVLGTDGFKQRIKTSFGRPLTQERRGRPRKRKGSRRKP